MNKILRCDAVETWGAISFERFNALPYVMATTSDACSIEWLLLVTSMSRWCKYFDILRSLYMDLEALLIGNVSCKLYIQNPRHPEISLVLITLCPRNIILVYLACERLSHYIILSSIARNTISVMAPSQQVREPWPGWWVMSSVPGDLQSKETNVNNIFLIHSSLKK